uniref:MFS transporter n=1 Tax=Streptomyces sp. NBC_01401 TaxID=2903854 RepID=A0AAU3GW94_9ACTN
MTATDTPPPGAPAGQARTTSVTAVVGLLIVFEVTSGFLQVGLAPLLPDLADHLGIGSAALNWVVSVQLLAAAVCVPLFGRLGDLYGHRRMLRTALVAIAVGTLVVALAPDYGTLLAGRVLQGPLAALLPLEIALVRDRLPVADARRAIARLVGALTLGALAGGVVMGLVDSAFGSLRLTLLVPAALAVACVPVSFLAVPESRNRAAGRVDWAGVVLLGGAMVALLGGVSGAESGSQAVRGSARVLGPVVLGLALLAVWVLVELRSSEPLVDVRALAARTTAPFYCAAFLFGVFYFGSQAPNSSFYAADPEVTGYGFGLSALSISLVLLPGAIGSVIGSLGTAAVARRIGYRPTLMAAFGLVALTFLQFAFLHGEIWQMAAGSAFTGLGIGLALGAMPTVIVEASDPSGTGIAVALYNNVKTLGGAVAGGVFAALLGAFLSPSTGEPGEGGYTALWLAASAAAVIALVATVFSRRREA